jgi:hypothetical protein
VGETRKPGKPLSPVAEKVRNHLASLSPEALQAMTPKTYRSRTHHVACSDAIFQMEKMRAKKALGLPKRAMAPRKAKAVVVKVPLQIPYAGRTFDVIAQVDIAAYPTPFATLKAFATEILQQCLGDQGQGLQLLLLSDPPTLEIRRPARG